MAWFRRVLIQDMAVLFTLNPHAPIFKFAPFNSTPFRQFAATSTAAIDAAEETARLAFQNLPQHLVASLHGALATQNLAFERERQTYQAQMSAMQGQMSQMQSLIELMAGSKRVKNSHDITDSFPAESTYLSNSSFTMPSPALSVPSDEPSDMLLNVFPPNPTLDASIAVDFSLHHMPGEMNSLFPSPAHTFHLPPTGPSASIPALKSPEERQAFYYQRYGSELFRKHAPEWVNGDWLPRYKYTSADSIWEYWTEWKDGVRGYMSVEELTTTWGAKWRRNIAGLKNENTRRMRVVNLILELSKKPRWNINLVNRFITDKYARQFRARAFSDYLKTAGNRAAVIAAAANFP
ncbi:hypothetical protein B0H14DRAFT_3445749 [Mycena olivaceomarginata]|nr:hypothetical protein B0H14DRAFT_3445749 [Mycena olivaceomarginata]